MAEPPRERARLRFGVAQALAQGRISFHYQPVVRAGHRAFPPSSRCWRGCAARRPAILPAGAFMPAVEAGPLGRAIDRLALAQALKALAANPGLRLSVNMSPLSMGDEEWLAADRRGAAAAAASAAG